MPGRHGALNHATSPKGSRVLNRILEWSASRGYEVAWGPVDVLESARADFDRRREAGEIAPGFVRDNLLFDFTPSRAGDEFRVLAVAVPRPAHLVTFLLGGRRIEAILPPTYEHYRSWFEDVRRDLMTHALPGAAVERIEVPLKAVASRLGLVRYGRNNVTYARSIGSWLQLFGYVTDADLPLDPGWSMKEPRLLDECDECAVCEATCPTGAIGPDRVLLRAERCLALATETPGAWPDWVTPSMHHCLVGCLSCQRSCPANAPLPVEDTGVVCDEAETACLLAGGQGHPETLDRVRTKLGSLGLSFDEELLGRNLRALIGARPFDGPPVLRQE